MEKLHPGGETPEDLPSETNLPDLPHHVLIPTGDGRDPPDPSFESIHPNEDPADDD